MDLGSPERSEVGLPDGDIPVALMFFNLGVDIGQLLFVAVFVSLTKTLHRLVINWRISETAFPRWAVLVPSYAMGSIAMYWLILRISLF